ncbi:hypothetical protein B0H10DRAFT_2091503 [Mycena sp. CBHHK59/15]|nr:hypothetical protein B0H10DRAFT_2091503 [Mycena sp. CBHHK59/15]
MKRSQASSESPVSEKKSNKKAKISAPNETADESAGWTKVEKRKQKKAQKQEVKLDATQPRFMYANSEIVKRNHAIGIDRSYSAPDCRWSPPNWLRINESSLIQKVVTLLIPGLTPELLSLPPLPTSATANPTSPSQYRSLIRGAPHPERVLPGPHQLCGIEEAVTQRDNSQRTREKDPAQYLLTLEQMVENDYPVPSYMADVFEKPPGWIETPAEQKASLLDEPVLKPPKKMVYSIDCEMCLTEDGKELTRICIIDFYSGAVVYDQLVKPAKPILDYLTRSASSMNRYAMYSFSVQAHVLRLLSPPASNPFSTSSAPPAPFLTPILIGHSLESDLKALKLCHPLCIDTAVLYHHPRGRPLKPGLAWLTKKWCGREIQTGGEGGHDPEEDARACLELLQKKMDAGPGFGEFKTDYESIFERMARTTKRTAHHKSAVVDLGNPAVMHGSKATTAIGCKDDDEVLKGLLEVVPSHDFVFGRFMALAETLGCACLLVGLFCSVLTRPSGTTPKPEAGCPIPELAPPPSPEVLACVVAALDQHLKTLYAALPPRTALVVFTGHSDPRRMALLNARKTAFETAIRSGLPAEELGPDMRWTASDGRDLEEAVALAKRGLVFLGVL